MLDNKNIYNERYKRENTNEKIYGPYNRWCRYLLSLRLTKIKDQKIDTVLDIGCGDGATTYFLAQQLSDSKVYGIDISETGIERAKKTYQRDNLFFELDTELESLKKRYDIITAFGVIEHIEEWQQVLMRITESAQKFLLFTFPTGRMRRPHEVNIGHFRNFKKNEMEKFLAMHNFAPLDIFYAGFPFYSPFYRDLCNFIRIDSNKIVQGEYSWTKKRICDILYFLFRYFSTTRYFGDHFVGLFKNKNNGSLLNQ